MVLEAAGQISTLIIYPFGTLISKNCVVIACLGLAIVSWPQPGDNFAISMETVEKTFLFVWLRALTPRGGPTGQKAPENLEMSTRLENQKTWIVA